MEDAISRYDRIDLRDPVLVAAFKGWNDAGDAATFAAEHLARVWGAMRIASIDPEEFYDFQTVRPQVELIDGETRKITWPTNEFFAARLPGSPHDVIVLVGVEPSHRWKTFTKLVVEIARENHVGMIITLGALLADVPHSREVPVTGTAGNQELIDRLGLQRSRYEGPTGIVGVLHDACAGAGISSASLWGAVPHYLAVTPNPKAALALVHKAVALIGAPAEVDDLERASAAYEDRVTEVVASDEDVQGYVRLLEDRADDRDGGGLDREEIPSGDALAEELEKYLRDQGGGDRS
jgi:proteasome assembly chaperone (PAC2) family protein